MWEMLAGLLWGLVALYLWCVIVVGVWILLGHPHTWWDDRRWRRFHD